MQPLVYYVGMDVHKVSISYCVKRPEGSIVAEGRVRFTRAALKDWVALLPQPWVGGLEATLFSLWIHYQLELHAQHLCIGHPLRRKAIFSGKKKNDGIDGACIADLLRANLCPAIQVVPSQCAELREVLRFRTLDGVGLITALTWALEVGPPERLPSISQAVSVCGLVSAQRSSAGVDKRGPLSKRRNQFLQSALVEAAKLAVRYNPVLKQLHEPELLRGDRNRATLAVARNLVADLWAADRGHQPTARPRSTGTNTAA